MTLLRGDKSIQNPTPLMVNGKALTVTDGWKFGIGFWLALFVAIPLIAVLGTFLFWLLVLLFDNLPGGL